MNNATPNTLSPELKEQIEKEANTLAWEMWDDPHNHECKRLRSYAKSVYSEGATPYALKLQQAEEMMERMEREIQNAWESRVNGQMTEHSSIRLIEIVRLNNHYKKAK